MNYNYRLQTVEVEHLDQITSAVSSPFFFQETSEKKIAHYGFGRDHLSNKILRNFSAEILHSLLPHTEKVHLEKGQEIYKADDDIACIYFPETAVVSEFQILADGKTTGVAMIGSEGLLGISALLGSPMSNNWAQALAGGTAFRISVSLLRQHFDYCKTVKRNILRYLGAYLAQISQKVVCNNHHQVSERLCSWILMFSDRSQNRNYPLSLTQEQLAFFLGAQRPSITTVTQLLREKGMINYRRGKLTILDRELLESAACDCYAATKNVSE